MNAVKPTLRRKILETEINDVAGYVKHVLEVSRGRNPLYRGHSDKKYDLIPSLGRHVKHPDGSFCLPDYLRGREKEALEQFRGESVPYIKDRTRTFLDVMAQAQHHGVPTRLMDWTTNPLVALYFAAKNIRNKVDGVVYILNAPKSFAQVTAGKEVNILEMPEDCAFVPQHIDARMAAQFSVFTLHAKPYSPMDKSKLESVWFKGEHKELIFAELHVLGFNSNTMFPGLSGIGERIRNAIFGQFS